MAVETGTRPRHRGDEDERRDGAFQTRLCGRRDRVGQTALGARSTIEKVARAMAPGVEFEKLNPTTSLMEDKKTGKFKDEVLNEKVLSAIVEFSIPLEKLSDALYALERVSHDVESVFSVDVCSRCNDDGFIPHEEILSKGNWWHSINVKTNVGLGRPRISD